MEKRILIINDIPGAGKVAANINLPILSACGFETAILPTLVLSAQTGKDFPGVVKHAMGSAFSAILSHWQANAIDFDGILTGYFANPQQIIDFRTFLIRNDSHRSKVFLVADPIMGDQGDFYQGVDREILAAYQSLLPHIDILLPNITEACLLSGIPYRPDLTLEDFRRMGTAIRHKGSHNVVITGVRLPQTPEVIGFLMFNAEHPDGLYLHHRYYPQDFFGTGDVVASLICALYAMGYPLAETIHRVGYFIERVIEATLALKRERKYGLRFETILGPLTQMAEGGDGNDE